MVEIKLSYKGDLRCQAVHGPSGQMITTDAPKDNHGKGESFSPTDLLATSLASCMMTIMAIYAQKHDFCLKGMTARIEKHMIENPRKIGKLVLDICIPKDALPNDQRSVIEKVAMTCPVHHSLHPDIQIDISFDYVSL